MNNTVRRCNCGRSLGDKPPCHPGPVKVYERAICSACEGINPVGCYECEGEVMVERLVSQTET